MSQRIESLTQEQEAMIPMYAKKWSDESLRTDPINPEVAFDAICEIYKIYNLTPPEKYFVYRSPEEALLGIRLYEVLDGEYIKDPRAYLKTADKNIVDQVMDSSALQTHINNFNYGNHDSYWISFYSFFKNEVGVEGLEEVDFQETIAKNCGWYSLYEGVVFMQERPTKIKLDDNNLPHCEDGAFLEYSDGFGISAWHGTVVPNEWIADKSTITPEIMLNHSNVEQRRCACEIVGWVEALKLMNCVEINSHPNPSIGTLLEATIPNIGVERFLKVECGTGRIFALPVPPDIKTALQGQCWINQCSEDEILNLEVRT